MKERLTYHAKRTVYSNLKLRTLRLREVGQRFRIGQQSPTGGVSPRTFLNRLPNLRRLPSLAKPCGSQRICTPNSQNIRSSSMTTSFAGASPLSDEDRKAEVAGERIGLPRRGSDREDFMLFLLDHKVLSPAKHNPVCVDGRLNNCFGLAAAPRPITVSDELAER
jgi:hypothetical protein